MKRKPLTPAEYAKNLPGRRTFLKRAGIAAAVGAGVGYLALSPEDWPLSLKDVTGLRSVPRYESFRLPDFRVAKPEAAADVGIGRSGDSVIGLRKALDAIGGITHYVKPGDVVLVKPNVAFDRAPNLGATTHPRILEALVRMLLVDCRAAEVRVTDNPIESPADCFAKTGIDRAAVRAGARVALPDGNSFRMLHTPGATLIENWLFMQRPFTGVNKVIGLSPVKDHNLCHASMGVKNWYGLLGGRRNQFHQDIHQIVSDLSIMIRPTLTIVDGTRVLMKNGPTGGDPTNVKQGDTVLAAVDPVAQDAWAFEHLLKRGDTLPEYLHLAEQKGGGRVDYKGRTREVV